VPQRTHVPARSRDVRFGIVLARSADTFSETVSYVDRNLLSGERVIYRARLHRVLYTIPVLLALAAIGALFFQNEVGYGFAIGFGALALISFIVAHVIWLSSEFAVTNMRVVAKTGFIQRSTAETLLSKIEAIAVDQRLVGRMLGYGTVQITGTGGTRETFRKIARPLELRRQIQSQIIAAEERRASAAPTASALPAEVREERECPWCAERILAKAKVCKHCGREISQ
jgi:uncharacterized membrane protein YdbT with pleckstrin-like domain